MALESTTIENLGRAFAIFTIAFVSSIFSKKGQEVFSRVRKEIYRRIYPHDTEIKKRIETAINELRIRIGASRVGLWQFTNGVVSFSGYTMKFAEMTMESYALGQQSIKSDFKKIPIEDVLDLVKAIQDSHRMWIGTQETEIAVARSTYEMYGIKTAVEWKFRNNDVYKGFLSVTYQHEVEINEEMVGHIEATAIYVYSLINKIKK